MTLESDFASVMEAESDLMDLLTGGVYEAIQVGEVSRQITPDAFDANKEIQPCALVKMGTEIPRGPYVTSVQTPVNIFFYERGSSVSIDEAMDMVYFLFNGQKVGDGVWRIEHESSTWNQSDDALDANLCVLRFVAVRLKSVSGSPS